MSNEQTEGPQRDLKARGGAPPPRAGGPAEAASPEVLFERATWGYEIGVAVQEYALERGWSGPVVYPDELAHHEATEEATEFLTENVAEVGQWYGWNDNISFARFGVASPQRTAVSEYDVLGSCRTCGDPVRPDEAHSATAAVDLDDAGEAVASAVSYEHARHWRRRPEPARR